MNARRKVLISALGTLIAVAASLHASAQEPLLMVRAKSPTQQQALGLVPYNNPQENPQAQTLHASHRFWDKENDWLFGGVAASRTLDYFSTLNMRRRGDHEILLTNEVVDNHAAFAAIEAAGTGVSVVASYVFHRYGHHKLERWTSIVHIGLATTGAARNYALKTVH